MSGSSNVVHLLHSQLHKQVVHSWGEVTHHAAGWVWPAVVVCDRGAVGTTVIEVSLHVHRHINRYRAPSHKRLLASSTQNTVEKRC